MERTRNIMTLIPNLICSIITVLGNNFDLEIVQFNSNYVQISHGVIRENPRCQFVSTFNNCNRAGWDLFLLWGNNKMNVLPPDILELVCQYLHCDITENYELELRPCQYFEIVQHRGRTMVFACVHQ